MALVLLSPPLLVVAVAGLALLPALGSSLASAVTQPEGREAAVVTFVVTASGTTILGIGSAFWGLVAGGVTALLLHRRRPPADSPTAPAAAADSTPTAAAGRGTATAAAPATATAAGDATAGGVTASGTAADGVEDAAARA
jgi:benzoate membrane transport protein